MMPSHYTGLFLDQQTQDMLRHLFPPRFPNVRGDHITLAVHDVGWPSFQPFNTMHIYRHIYDNGMEAFQCSADGNMFRPDGIPYHITYSYAVGLRARDLGARVQSMNYTSLGYIPVQGQIECREIRP